jgi:hypothetical protein
MTSRILQVCLLFVALLIFGATSSVLAPAAGAQYVSFTLAGGQQSHHTNASWGTMDLWLPMSASSPCSESTGVALTTTILSNCTFGGTFTTSNFGETNGSGNPVSGSGLYVSGIPFVTGSDTNGYTPLSISYAVLGGITSTTWDFGIYSDSSSTPSSLLCHVGTSTITPVSNFNTISLVGKSCPTLSASTRYWIGLITASNTAQFSSDTGSCPGTTLKTTFSNSTIASALLPSTFPANTPDTNDCYGYYSTLNGNTPSMSYTVSSTCCSTFTTAASVDGLGGSVTVAGTPYLASTATQSEQMGNGTGFVYFTTNNTLQTITNSPIQTIVSNGFITFGAANAGGLGTTFDLINFFDNGSSPNGFVVLGFNNGNFGACGYCAYIESDPGGSTTYSPGIAVTPGSTYQFSLLDDEVGGTAKLTLYTPGTCSVVGSATVAQLTGNNIVNWRVGNAENGTSSGNTTFQNLMLDWTNHTYPNCP